MKIIEKISLVVLLSAYSGFLVSLHAFERLYPINIVYLAIVSTAIVSSIYFSRKSDDDNKIWLLQILFASVSYKTTPYIVGKSLLGTDPDRFARSVNEIVATGTTEQIYLSFYSSVPLFPIFSSIISLIWGISAYSSVISMTLIYAIGLPLAFYYFFRSITANMVILATSTLFFTYSTSSTIYSFIPIGQTLSNIYLLFSFALFFRSVSEKRLNYSIILLFMGLSMAYVHKFGTVVIFVFGLIFVFLTRYNPQVRISNKAIRFPMYTVLILGMFSLLQWVYISGFLDELVIRIFALFSASEPILSDPPNPSQAEQINQGLQDTVLRRGYVISVMAVGASCLGILGFLQFYSKEPYLDELTSYYIYSLGTLSVGFIMFSVLFSVAINPIRAYIYVEPIMVAFIFISFLVISRNGSTIVTSISIIAVIMLFASQMITPMAIPDHTDRERQYLTQPEMETITFEKEHIDGLVKTDNFYSHKSDEENYERPDRTEAYSGEELLNNDLRYGEAEYAHIRNDVNTYRLFDQYRGWWRLTYDPSAELAIESHRIYTNGDVDTYANRN